MSQSGSFQVSGGGGGIIQTINGDTGSITGPVVTIYANNAANNSGSSVKFVNSGTVSKMNLSDANGNTCLGYLAGSATLSGIRNTAVGPFAMNVAGNSNVNVAIGTASLTSLTAGDSNCCVGSQSGLYLLTGRNNVLISSDLAGQNYMSAESNNILLGNVGVGGENNVIRIGQQGSGNRQQNKAFLAGVTGVTVAASSPVAVDSNGQLSDLGFGTATQVLTSNGPGVSPTWQAAGGGGTINAVINTPIIPGIDYTTVQTIPLYTPTTDFVPNSLILLFDTIVADLGGGQFSIGTNSPNFDNIISTGSFGTIGVSGDYTLNVPVSPIHTVLNGETITLNISTGETATTCTGRAFITGSPLSGGGSGFTPVNWSVKLSGNISNVTGDGTDYSILYDTTVFDSATGYNSGTGLYTIPTTGIYQISITHFVFGGGVADTIFLGFLNINSGTIVRLMDANPGALGLTANSEFMQSATFLYSATAGDTIGVHVVVNGGAKDVGVAGGAQSCLFSGFRVG